MTGHTDLELVERFQRGDESAFNELLLRYKERIYWTARRFLQSHDDADDVVQQVLLNTYHALKEFRSDSGVFTWLYRITVNTSLNALRKRRVRDFFSLDEIVTAESPASERPDESFEVREQRSLIEKAVGTLPEKQKTVFIMRYYDELPYEEIAKVLKTSVGGLKANYFHAMRKIEKYVRRAHGA